MRARGLADALMDLLFPPRCQVCGELCDDPLCATCMEDVEFITDPVCPYCGQAVQPGWPPGRLCAECRDGRAVSGARAAGFYAGTLRDAVRRFKFDGRTRLAEPLAEMLVVVVRREVDESGLPLGDCAALVPVPLHPARLQWRGFDQARMLCERMAEAVAMPVWTDVLARIRNTTPQTELRGSSRRENVLGAFEARRGFKLRGRSILLVDDVFTTGATIEECARELRRAGAAAVYALTVCRTAPLWHHARFMDHDDRREAAQTDAAGTSQS